MNLFPRLALALFFVLAIPLRADVDDLRIKVNGKSYRIIKVIAKGGAGTVYEATGPDGKVVAVKVFKKGEEGERASLERAKELQKTSAKDKTVAIFDVGAVQSFTAQSDHLGTALDFASTLRESVGAVVMEKVPGTLNDLGPYFRIGSAQGQIFSFTAPQLAVRVEESYRLATQMGDLWSGMAEKGYLYGDFKPWNIGFVRQPLEIKLLDLGSMVRGPITSETPLAVRKAFLGTSGFQPPELVNLHEKTPAPGIVYDNYSDYFAMGRTLLDLFCGQCDANGFEESVLAYSRKFNKPESQAMMAKLVFLSEFIRASQHDENANRRAAVAASPLLSQYLTGTTVPKVLKNAEQMAELSSIQLAKNLEAMESRVKSRRANWKPATLVAYDILALPGESFPRLDKKQIEKGLRPDKEECCRNFTLLLITGASVVTGVLGTIQYFRWKEENKANQNPNVPAKPQVNPISP